MLQRAPLYTGESPRVCETCEVSSCFCVEKVFYGRTSNDTCYRERAMLHAVVVVSLHRPKQTRQSAARSLLCMSAVTIAPPPAIVFDVHVIASEITPYVNAVYNSQSCHAYHLTRPFLERKQVWFKVSNINIITCFVHSDSHEKPINPFIDQGVAHNQTDSTLETEVRLPYPSFH